VALAASRARQTLDDRTIPTLGVLSAFVFAAQMVNLPVPGGTSGHLVGAVLLTATVGPWLALLAMACVLLVQCLLFQDGGLTALGANLVNMGVVGVLSGTVVLGLARRHLPRYGLEVGAFLAGWLAALASAALAAVEIALSGRAPLTPVLVAMLGWHALIGLIEGGGTAVVLRALRRARPELVEARP
jgi:cobalt/nickel transport system permease protein